ncbi:MAG: ABC transporter ATP-binding protein [Saccharothrix sp.]|nr:ABC transporter ATP-binding protein [Saccharothrix sp.]
MAGSAARLAGHLRGRLPMLAGAAALSLLAAGATLLQPLLIRSVVTEVGDGRPVGAAAAWLAVLLVGVAVLSGARDLLVRQVAETVVLRLRSRLVDHVLRLRVGEYDRASTGDLLARVIADSALLRPVVSTGLLDLAIAGLMAAGAAVAALVLDPVLFATAAVGLAVGVLGAAALARRTRPLSRTLQQHLGEMTAKLDRAVSGARTIRAACAQDREAASVGESVEAAYRAGLRLGGVQAVVVPLSQVTVNAVFLLVLSVGGARVAAGALTVGDLVAFVLFLFFLVMPVGQMVSAYTQLQTGLGALRRVDDVLAMPVEDDGGRHTGPARTSPREPTPAIVFDRVGFAYPGAEPVLRDVSFTVERGSRTALVGLSGAGKSTLLALVERFYDTGSGRVLVDGTDVRSWSRQALRRQLGYVEQQAPVLAGSLRENLTLAAPRAADERLVDALAAVNLGGLAARGLDSPVGEGGGLLSGGERQRLCVARALVPGPPVLLLDEPTSNLDAHNEAVLRDSLGTAAAGRTVLVVAHRLATVVDADKIVLLDRGTVAAVGTHEELVATSPLYRELAGRQLLTG